MITAVTANVAIDKIYMLDNFHKNGVFRVHHVEAQAGGKGLNVARVLHVLGLNVIATGFIGGHNGRFIEESLYSEGVKGDFVKVNGESRICLNIIDTCDKVQTELLEPGPEVTPQDQEKLKAKVRTLAGRSKVVTLSGSLARGLPSSFYAEMIDLVREEGAKVILDTSGEALKEGVRKAPYMVKPNLQEAQSLLGKPIQGKTVQKNFLEKVLEWGVEVVALTLGEEGAVIGSKDGFFEITPPKVQAINTVGCGDAFVAGFAAGVFEGRCILEAAKLAVATATASAANLGTGKCDRQLVTKLLPEVKVKAIV